MLAYIAWHRPADGADTEAYERAVERLHASLAHRPPSGFCGSAAFRAAELPWLTEHPSRSSQDRDSRPEPGGGPGWYEDWYLVDSWAAIGVLEEAAVSRGHLTAHEDVAAKADALTAGIYRFAEGNPALGSGRVGVWVTRAPGREHPSIEALLGDGMDPADASLWRRCLGLGPAPEYCLLATEPPPGVGAARLPRGWSVTVSAREPLL